MDVGGEPQVAFEGYVQPFLRFEAWGLRRLSCKKCGVTLVT